MRFFLISNMYPTTKYPGYGSFVKNVCDGLSQYDMYVSYKAVIKGKGKGPIDKIFKYLYFYISIIVGFFKEYDFIYIHFPNQAIPLLNLLYKIRKPKIIVNFHGEDLLYRKTGYTNILGKKTELFCQKYATSIIVPSQYYKDIVVSKNILPSNRVIVSPSGGIDPNIFYSSDKKNYNSILHIGYVGRLEIDKGIKDFLLTCNQLNQEGINFKAIVIGYGNYYEEMQLFIKENKLEHNITTIKGISQSKLGEYYRKLDLMIFSSSRRSESLGLTGIEAMACGVPVIGGNVGGIVSYLEDNKNGWIVPIHDVNAIINRIHIFMNLNTDSKMIMVHNCIETGKKYYRNLVCKNLYQDIKEQLSI